MKHWLVTPTAYGELAGEDAREFSEGKHMIFPCGKCSDPNNQVYHNVIGRHHHWQHWKAAA